ncbi:S41 family peptidase [Oceanospirillum sp. D5]|uniref:S41 family peptidase n=2 Tax=Oceanospirillum sediminis TaxID=2760088 RepID=A0A839IN89_9GAMM|nr:S41 family peptidase [Oceanospirillum sediminis]
MHLTRLARLSAPVILGMSLTAPLALAETAKEPAGLPLEELRTFGEVFERIKRAYVHEVDDKELLENAIRGMLSGLDPHSNYLKPEDFEELQESTQGEFGGLGLEVGSENGFIKVVTPLDDTPAAQAGLKPQDLIIKLDDTPVKGMSLQKAVEMMRGKPGTDIRLTIVRDGVEGPFEVTLTRDLIRITSVKHRMLDEHYGYIRITQFQVHTGEEVEKSLLKLHEKAGSKLRGLVLDLRNNPGGVLQAAVEVVDAFITEGLIVYTEGRLNNSELRFSATDRDPSLGIPVVILINEGTASASEIVSGALQDHRRAVIMGTQSFGKGSVQTILPLASERALKLTTALYFTPSGRSIQAQGVSPDIEVRPARLTPLETKLQVTEADLDGHLEVDQKNSTDGTATPDKKQDKRSVSKKEDLAQTDYQLFEALSLLKGLHILQPEK